MRIPDAFEAYRPEPDPDLRPVPEHLRGFVVRLDLRDVRPPVWRRLELRGDLTLLDLHYILQIAMGWQDCHLHRFRAGASRWAPYFRTEFDLSEGDDGIPEGEVRLDQVVAKKGDALCYEYDFGDSWHHLLKVEKVLDEVPETVRCTGGRMACPPEDSGGIYGFAELSAWVRSGYDESQLPTNFEDAEDVRAWLPDGWDPDRFDPDRVNDALDAALAAPVEVREELAALAERIERQGPRTLREILGSDAAHGATTVTEEEARRLTEVFSVFLDVIGDGVDLTGAGYLPPTVVEQVAERCGVTSWWVGKADREDRTIPVLRIRENAQGLGLVSIRKGRLSPTAAARRARGDAQELLGHVLGHLPVGRRRHEQEAGWLTLALVAGGVTLHDCPGLVSGFLADLGWRDGRDRFSPPSGQNPTLDVLRDLSGWSRTSGWPPRDDDPAVAVVARAVIRNV